MPPSQPNKKPPRCGNTGAARAKADVFRKSAFSPHCTRAPGKRQGGLDPFACIRAAVSAEQAARRYGLTVRQGRALCPFHRDTHPSLTFHAGRWRCWVCDMGGDAVDLTARLLGLDALGAARQIDRDWGLGLALGQPKSAQQRRAAAQRRERAALRRSFDAWRRRTGNQLAAAHRLAQGVRRHFPGWEALTAEQTLALQWQAAVAHWCDCLAAPEIERQMEVFRQRKEVERLCQRILTTAPKKSGAA